MKKLLLLAVTHLVALGIGFALGIYVLPILIAPDGPSAEAVKAATADAAWSGTFRRDLKDSDAFHWGEGKVRVGVRNIALDGLLAPGPDYKLYLSPAFVETEDDFMRLKPRMARVGDVKTFENFVVPVPEGVDPAQYKAVIVWCERFGQFITAASYR